MISIDVKGDLESVVEQWARVMGSQTPFATALALTRTAKAAKEEVEQEMLDILERPTPFTMRGFRMWPATKHNLVARVAFRDEDSMGSPRDWLSPIVYGGERKLKSFERSLYRVGLLPSGMAAVPGSAARMDAYGNMSRGQITQILSYFKAFGEQGYSANMTDKRRDSMARGSKRTGKRGMSYFVGRPNGGRHPAGIWQKTSFGEAGSAIKPIIIYIAKPSYHKMLNVPGISRRVVSERFVPELNRAMTEAMATATYKSQLKLI